MSRVSQTRALRISEACVEQFFERGTTRVNIDELAAAAEVSRRTFHRYFESKEASIRPVLAHGMTLMAAHLSEADPEIELADAVVAALAHAVDGRYRRRTSHLIPLLDETDGMRAVFFQAISDGAHALTEPIAARLGVPTASAEARVNAEIVATIVRLALLDSYGRNTDPVETFRDYLDRAGILRPVPV